MKDEICQNCGHTIGKLEQAYVYDNKIVCRQCFSVLTPANTNKIHISLDASPATKFGYNLENSEVQKLYLSATLKKKSGNILGAINDLEKAEILQGKASLKLASYLQIAGRGNDAWKKYNQILQETMRMVDDNEQLTYLSAIYDKMMLFLEKEGKFQQAVISGIFAHIMLSLSLYRHKQYEAFREYISDSSLHFLVDYLLINSKYEKYGEEIISVIKESLKCLPKINLHNLGEKINKLLNQCDSVHISKAVLSACPYCKYVFEQKPRRNRKCPSCQKRIVLRRGKLLTEVQATDYDRKKYAKIGRQITASQKQSLIEYKKSGVVKYVEILSAGESSCDACLALDNKKLLVEDELRNPTLPVKNCTGGYGYCRCTYIPVIEDG